MAGKASDGDLVVAVEDIYDRRNPAGPVVLVRRKGETISRDILVKYGYEVPARPVKAKRVSAAEVEDKARAPRRGR